MRLLTYGVLTLTAAALFYTLFLLSTPFSTIFRFSGTMGWIALGISAILVVQGFRKIWTSHKSDSFHLVSARICGWREMHVALSILVTVLAAIHGFIFLPMLTSLFIGYVVGVISFVVLLVLGLSGIALEARRGERSFRYLNQVHLAFTLAALSLALLHIAMSTPAFLNLDRLMVLG